MYQNRTPVKFVLDTNHTILLRSSACSGEANRPDYNSHNHSYQHENRPCSHATT